MTYYKYQPRDPQIQVNWAEAAQNVTNILKEEQRVRTEKKSAIDEATRNFQDQLNTQPQGQSTSIREWGLKFGESAQKQLLMQEQLLKSGMLKPSDYTVMRQNLTDGTDQAFGLMQKYQDVFAGKMERMKSQDITMSSQKLEQWAMANAEGFANFNNSELVINPETGKVSAAMMRMNSETGLRELTQDPNQFVAVSSLQGQILQEYDEFDSNEAANKFVEETGAWTMLERIVGSRTQAGQVLSKIDPFNKTLSEEDRKLLGIDEAQGEAINYYLEAENAMITGLFANPYNVTSMLTENVVMSPNGKVYDFTYDETEAKNDASLILMRRDGNGGMTPVFDTSINPHAKEQQDEVRAYMRNSIRNKVSRDQKSQTVNDWQRSTPPTASSIKTKKEDEANMNYLGAMSKLFSGTTAEVNEAINTLRSANTDIKDIDRNGDDIIVSFNSARGNETISFRGDDDTQLTEAAWIKANTNFFRKKTMDNIGDYLKGWEDKNFAPESVGFGGSDVKSKESAELAFNRKIDTILNVKTFDVTDSEGNYDDDVVKDNVKNALQSIPGGHQYTVTDFSFGEGITIENGNFSYEIDLSDKDKAPGNITRALKDLKIQILKNATMGEDNQEAYMFFLQDEQKESITRGKSSRRETQTKVKEGGLGDAGAGWNPGVTK